MSSEPWRTWCPDDSIWAVWAKPLLFALGGSVLLIRGRSGPPLPEVDVSSLELAPHESFVIVDAEGARSVAFGLALAQRGFRPVPLFNGVDGADPLIDVQELYAALGRATGELSNTKIDPEAPPAFLLDARRMTGTPTPRRFDNRWVVIPEDFPSANRLLSRGLRRCVLIGKPAHHDLDHVLVRYARAGITIELAEGAQTLPYRPNVPSALVSLFRRTLVQMGLRRSSAGGFGGFVPEPQTSGGHG